MAPTRSRMPDDERPGALGQRGQVGVELGAEIGQLGRIGQVAEELDGDRDEGRDHHGDDEDEDGQAASQGERGREHPRHHAVEAIDDGVDRVREQAPDGEGKQRGPGLLREHRGDDDHDRREDAATQGLGRDRAEPGAEQPPLRPGPVDGGREALDGCVLGSGHGVGADYGVP